MLKTGYNRTKFQLSMELVKKFCVVVVVLGGGEKC